MQRRNRIGSSTLGLGRSLGKLDERRTHGCRYLRELAVIGGNARERCTTHCCSWRLRRDSPVLGMLRQQRPVQRLTEQVSRKGGGRARAHRVAGRKQRDRQPRKATLARRRYSRCSGVIRANR